MKFKHEQQIIDGETWIKFNSEFEKKRYFYSNLWTAILIVVLVIIGGILYFVVMNHIDLLKTVPCDLCMEKGYECFKAGLRG